MRIQEYRLEELHFAYCYHVYLRWRTHRRRPQPCLARLDTAALDQLARPLALHVLDCVCDTREVRTLVSLRPEEAVSGCASKLKGQTSKWLRQALGLEQPTDLLGKGYFASTSGGSTRDQVDGYLDLQGEHHGYANRRLPPLYVATYDLPPAAAARLQARHAYTVLQFHVVLATWRRHGVFGPQEAAAVAARWLEVQDAGRFALRKVSFLPDHVHVAVQTHPTVLPGELAVRLMNAAQALMWERFADAAIQARVERLWSPSAYVGSYGELATPQVQQYLRNWEASLE
jgi:REP element-mobilizing transposase RayT